MRITPPSAVTRFLRRCSTTALVIISRFGFFPPNVSVLGSFGFFSGSLSSLVVSVVVFDLLKGGLYPGFLFTYIGFFMYYLLGKIARGRTKRQLILLPIASFLFFIISNFGVWWYWYPRSFAGLLACYAAAIPFYRLTLIGDVLFGYGYLLAQKLILNKRFQFGSQFRIITSHS